MDGSWDVKDVESFYYTDSRKLLSQMFGVCSERARKDFQKKTMGNVTLACNIDVTF